MLILPPKRPTRVLPGASNISTCSAVPRIEEGCAERIASSVSFATASTKPSPRIFVDVRNVRTSLPSRTRS